MGEDWQTLALPCDCTLGTDKSMRAAAGAEHSTLQEFERAVALGSLSFQFCPLHAAAPRLLKALEGLYARYGRDYPADDEDWDRAEAAMKEARGEPTRAS